MGLTTDRMLEAIALHSTGLADAAEGNLTAEVSSCPGWDVADLVWHVTEVHWLWRTIAAELLAEPPDEARQPTRPGDDRLIEVFRDGASALVETLRGADQRASCWTWYPPQQDVAFITRHQVQEAAVHHADAVHAAGRTLVVEPDVAADCVEEFLTTSLAEADDVAELGSLDGELVLAATDLGRTWTVAQATPSDGLAWRDGGDVATVSGTASDLLLWIYGRVDLPVTDEAVVARFRRLSSTD